MANYYVTITGDFEYFQHFNFEKGFLENGNLFYKTRVTLFSWKCYDWKRNIFFTKLHCQKPIIAQKIKFKTNGMQVRNVPITKNRVLPLTTLCFWKFNLSTKTLIICCFNVPTTQVFMFILFVSAWTLFKTLLHTSETSYLMHHNYFKTVLEASSSLITMQNNYIHLFCCIVFWFYVNFNI